eukprot:768733-Hanusia_phi.AAC.9
MVSLSPDPPLLCSSPSLHTPSTTAIAQNWRETFAGHAVTSTAFYTASLLPQDSPASHVDKRAAACSPEVEGTCWRQGMTAVQAARLAGMAQMQAQSSSSPEHSPVPDKETLSNSNGDKALQEISLFGESVSLRTDDYVGEGGCVWSAGTRLDQELIWDQAENFDLSNLPTFDFVIACECIYSLEEGGLAETFGFKTDATAEKLLKVFLDFQCLAAVRECL